MAYKRDDKKRDLTALFEGHTFDEISTTLSTWFEERGLGVLATKEPEKKPTLYEAIAELAEALEKEAVQLRTDEKVRRALGSAKADTRARLKASFARSLFRRLQRCEPPPAFDEGGPGAPKRELSEAERAATMRVADEVRRDEGGAPQDTVAQKCTCQRELTTDRPVVHDYRCEWGEPNSLNRVSRCDCGLVWQAAWVGDKYTGDWMWQLLAGDRAVPVDCVCGAELPSLWRLKAEHRCGCGRLWHVVQRGDKHQWALKQGGNAQQPTSGDQPEKLPGCPICGAEATGDQWVACTACSFAVCRQHWLALPRRDESVAKVTMEMEENAQEWTGVAAELAKDRSSKSWGLANTAAIEFGRFANRLKSCAAPDCDGCRHNFKAETARLDALTRRMMKHFAIPMDDTEEPSVEQWEQFAWAAACMWADENRRLSMAVAARDSAWAECAGLEAELEERAAPTSTAPSAPTPSLAEVWSGDSTAIGLLFASEEAAREFWGDEPIERVPVQGTPEPARGCPAEVWRPYHTATGYPKGATIGCYATRKLAMDATRQIVNDPHNWSMKREPVRGTTEDPARCWVVWDDDVADVGEVPEGHHRIKHVTFVEPQGNCVCAEVQVQGAPQTSRDRLNGDGAGAGAELRDEIAGWREVGAVLADTDPMRPHPSPASALAHAQGLIDANRRLRKDMKRYRNRLANHCSHCLARLGGGWGRGGQRGATMKTHFDYIHFVKVEQKAKTSVWECRNNRSNDRLGVVRWYGPWRQYCFIPEPLVDLVFNGGCLDDIRSFMRQL